MQERTCRYEHGPLEKLPEWYALDQLVPMTQSAGAGILARAALPPDGPAFAVRLWRCPVCGYVELSDEDYR